MKALLLIISLLISGQVSAFSNALSVDRALTKNLLLSFPNEQKITPKDSDFNVVNYVLMSNDEGQRWAVVTLKNTASGSRSFEQNQLLALFANGTRRAPLEYKLNFEGDETQSITLSFGDDKFPILSIYSSQDL